MRNLEHNTFALKLVTFHDDEMPVIEVLPYIFLPLDTDLSDFAAFKSDLYFEADLWGPTSVERHKEEIGFEMFEHAALELARELKFNDRLSFGHSDDVRDPYFIPALLALALHGDRRGGLGLPFIEHPRSVVLKAEVALVENAWTDRDFIPGLCAAWLQNVLDSNNTDFYRKVEAEDLLAWGVSGETIELVDLLTEDEEAPHDLYLARLRTHSTARALKLAEIAQLIWAQKSAGRDTSEHEKQLAELGYHPDVDEWMPTLMTTELLSGWPKYGLAISEQISNAEQVIPARFKFERADMRALESLMFGPGDPEQLEAVHSSDDVLAIALFCAYFARFNQIFFNVESLVTEWRFRGAIGKPVEPRFLSSASVSIEEIHARAKRVFANQDRFVAALRGSQRVEDNGFVWPSSGPSSLLEGFSNDELAEMAALGMNSQFGPQPYAHEFKTILGAILDRMPRSH
jgi:hypothetical protein